MQKDTCYIWKEILAEEDLDKPGERSYDKEVGESVALKRALSRPTK